LVDPLPLPLSPKGYYYFTCSSTRTSPVRDGIG
jgi:hypothetical protein